MFIRKKRARTILWAIMGTLVFASSAAITSAYFTSTDQTVRNILTPGTVRGELTETDWEEKNGEHLLPGESRKKNPAVRNAGTLASWMFLEVEIPVKTISLVDLKTPEQSCLTLKQIRTGNYWSVQKRKTVCAMSTVIEN